VNNRSVSSSSTSIVAVNKKDVGRSCGVEWETIAQGTNNSIVIYSNLSFPALVSYSSTNSLHKLLLSF